MLFNLLNRRAALNAAHAVYTSFYWDLAEERGIGHGPGVELTGITPRPADSDLEPILCYYLGRLEQAWGLSVGLVFHVMELDETAQEDALFSILMSCHGHGIGIEDNFSEEFRKARHTLEFYKIDPAPFYDEGMHWSDLADAQLEAEGYPYVEPEEVA